MCTAEATATYCACHSLLLPAYHYNYSEWQEVTNALKDKLPQSPIAKLISTHRWMAGVPCWMGTVIMIAVVVPETIVNAQLLQSSCGTDRLTISSVDLASVG
jgi:hypothetical protein